MMFKNSGFNLKRVALQIVPLHICAAFFISSCGPADCSLQMLAGGSEYCEETIAVD